jgi:hypothetical protein
VHLGLIYPCLLGTRMLGSTVFPWLISGPLSLRTEDCLVYSFIMMGFVLSIIAYDYQVKCFWKYDRLSVPAQVLDVWNFIFFISNMQEIGVLVTLFCLFHACVGLILPSLARLRTMYAKTKCSIS